jgi:arylsulfatase A-like enzyme
VPTDRSVLFITVDQWRGDSLSCLGHPLVETPSIDALAARGVLFANHWANTAPCGPSRASLYTGMYMHNHRSVTNGTPLDARFTNFALLARDAGWDPVLFGYTDTSVDPRTVPPDDPRLSSYESVLPGLRPVVHDPYESGSLEWGRWLAAQGVDVPSDPRQLYEPDLSYPGASEHGKTWAPALFGADQTETAFITGEVIRWLEQEAGDSFFAHVAYIRPHPPRRNPAGYHDLYSADDVPDFVRAPDRAAEMAVNKLNAALMALPVISAPVDEREARQTRATYHSMQREVDDQLGRLFAYLESSGRAASTLVVLTSDHGEMGGDHYLLEKLGYWDESYRVPLVVVDPTAAATATRGSRVDEFTEAVDVLPTILDWLGIETPPQIDGWSLQPFIHAGAAPPHWRNEAYFEWDFRNPLTRFGETYLGIPMEHCSLAVLRGRDYKYVQFAADPEVLAPLLYDLDADPHQLESVAGSAEYAGRRIAAAERLARLRMRNSDRTLSGQLLSMARGLVTYRDDWR